MTKYIKKIEDELHPIYKATALNANLQQLKYMRDICHTKESNDYLTYLINSKENN